MNKTDFWISKYQGKTLQNIDEYCTINGVSDEWLYLCESITISKLYLTVHSLD